MSWINSFSLIMRSSVTALRDKVQDPERMMYQLICDMEEDVARVRTNVTRAVADEIQLGRRVQEAREEVERWSTRAHAALRRGDEEGGRAAVERRIEADRRVATLEDEYQKQRDQVSRLRRSLTDLEDKIRQARQKQTLLLARLVRAEGERRIQGCLDQAQGRSAFAEFRRLEARVERAEAMAEACDRMDGRDPDVEDLERRFEQDEMREAVEAELDNLRRRLAEEEES